MESEEQNSNFQGLKSNLIILFFFIWGIFWIKEFDQHFKEILTEYELGYKIKWSEIVEHNEPNLSFEFLLRKGKMISYRGPHLKVFNTATNQIMVSEQYSEFKLFNTELKLYPKNRYLIKNAEFFYSPDHSVMLNRQGLYWLTKATIVVDEDKSSRLYIKKNNPTKSAAKQLNNKIYFYVLIISIIFVLGLLFLLKGLIKQFDGTHQNKLINIGLFSLALMVLFYSLFYKFLYLWLQVEFRF